jgi:cytochrome c
MAARISSAVLVHRNGLGSSIRTNVSKSCANCHVTSGNSAGNVQQGPPSFPMIARARTADQLRAFLSHPHGAMPDLSLTRAEIDDLIGYIETLR